MKENLPVRKRIRVQDYDYSEENMYFITICVKGRLQILLEKLNTLYGKNHFMNIL